MIPVPLSWFQKPLTFTSTPQSNHPTLTLLRYTVKALHYTLAIRSWNQSAKEAHNISYDLRLVYSSIYGTRVREKLPVLGQARGGGITIIP